MNRLRLVSILLIAAALACGGAVLAVLEALRPEAAAPELAERRRAARTVRTVAAAAPDAAPDVATVRVYGFVRDLDGEPVEGAEVGVYGHGAYTDADGAYTDADGAYTVQLPPSANRVFVGALGYDDEVVP